MDRKGDEMGAHNDVGAFGEALTRYTLAQVAPVQDGRVADLLCLGVEVEVKTATPSLYNGQTRGYQFLLRKKGHTDHRKADVIVLICLDEELRPLAVYVVPAVRLQNCSKVTIPRSLRTPFGVFRDRWDVIADAYVQKWAQA